MFKLILPQSTIRQGRRPSESSVAPASSILHHVSRRMRQLRRSVVQRFVAPKHPLHRDNF